MPARVRRPSAVRHHLRAIPHFGSTFHIRPPRAAPLAPTRYAPPAVDEPDQHDSTPPNGDVAEGVDSEPHPEDGWGDDSDLDLATLAAPPKWQRSVTLGVMLVTAVLSTLAAWSLRSEALYALSDQAPLDVGNLRDAALGEQHANRYVRAYANLERAPTVGYGRIAEPDTFQLAPVAGVDGRWVEHRVPDRLAGPRFLPPSRVAGRLVRVRDLGARYRGVAAALEQAQPAASERGAWLLLDGVDPHAEQWCLALTLMLLAFAGWNVYGATHLIRKVRAP